MKGSKPAARVRSKDMIGRNIGGFIIRNLLGKGASGVVFEAVQDGVGQTVALKILTSKWASDRTNLARFRREAISAARIQHPNVVKVVNFGESNGLFYMAMTLVGGGNLGDQIAREGALDLPTVARYGSQMASALAAIDDAGLIHRDVKPANIMLDQDGNAWLTDLGLAKAADSSQDITLKGYTVGTPNYIAPEQAMAEDTLGIACDVYSLGATLYHAATGRLLFARDNAFQVMKAHVREQPADPREYRKEIPEDLAELLLEMLAKAPEERPHPAAVAKRFDAILEDFMSASTAPMTANKATRRRPSEDLQTIALGVNPVKRRKSKPVEAQPAAAVANPAAGPDSASATDSAPDVVPPVAGAPTGILDSPLVIILLSIVVLLLLVAVLLLLAEG